MFNHADPSKLTCTLLWCIVVILNPNGGTNTADSKMNPQIIQLCWCVEITCTLFKTAPINNLKNYTLLFVISEQQFCIGLNWMVQKVWFVRNKHMVWAFSLTIMINGSKIWYNLIFILSKREIKIYTSMMYSILLCILLYVLILILT